jgi:hypothetical protein
VNRISSGQNLITLEHWVTGKSLGGHGIESIGFVPTDDGGVIGTGLSNSYGSDENRENIVILEKSYENIYNII